MKREIIFRGLTLDGKWKYGYYFRQGAFSFIQNEKGGNEAVLPESAGQFTGILDCKGNRIFEGDILKINTAVCVGNFFEGNDEDVPQEIICEVVYRTDNASFDLDTLESDTHLTGWGFYDGEGYTIEITGNIHEV